MQCAPLPRGGVFPGYSDDFGIPALIQIRRGPDATAEVFPLCKLLVRINYIYQLFDVSGLFGHAAIQFIKHNTERNNNMDYRRGVSHFLSVFLLFTCLATPAAAIPVAVVGAVDNFLASSVLPSSGKATEEGWVSSVLGFASTIVYRNETTASSGWELVNGTADHWAHRLDVDPAYFVLNLGVGRSGADTHYLYENIVSLSWAVIDLSEMLAGQNLDFNFGRVSHISEFDGSVRLSEPGSSGLLLIGFGLLSLRSTLRWLSFRGSAN